MVGRLCPVDTGAIARCGHHRSAGRVASSSLQLIVVFVLVVSGLTGLIVTAIPGIAAAANPSVTWTIQQSYLASASKLSSVSCPTSNDFWLSIWSVGAPNSAANCDISSDSWYCVGYTAGYNAASEMVWAAEHDTQGQAGAFLPSYAILESGRLRYWDMLSGCIAIH